MIAQIRTGLWVRNHDGFVIRGQLLRYHDFMLRELCYDQDLFIVQAAFAIVEDVDSILISIINRFQLLGWINGLVLSDIYEGPHFYGMVEEILYIIITILSENASASQMPLQVRAVVRQEIIHVLVAVSSCTGMYYYTDLVKRIAERISS